MDKEESWYETWKKESDKQLEIWKEKSKYCTRCGEKSDGKKHNITGDRLCESCYKTWIKNNILYDVYSHNWGIIFPGNTHVWYEQQTEGGSCNHVKIEGSFVPIDEPHKLIQKADGGWYKKDLLRELTSANYDFKDTKEIWDEINEHMGWEYEIVDAPEGQPNNQEGLFWVKFTKFHGEGEIYDRWKNVRNCLIGKTVCLIYPNCD